MDRVFFGIDASNDPPKFQDDWPSGSPLIGAWSLASALNVLMRHVGTKKCNLTAWCYFLTIIC